MKNRYVGILELYERFDKVKVQRLDNGLLISVYHAPIKFEMIIGFNSGAVEYFASKTHDFDDIFGRQTDEEFRQAYVK